MREAGKGGERSGGPRPVVPPPLIGVLTGAAMYGVARLVPGLAFTLPLQRPLAVILCVAGIAIDAIALAAFFRARTAITPFQPEKASALVTSGLYRYSRNPMYAGMLLTLTGFGIWLGQPLNLALLALFVALLNHLQIRPEEQALSTRFGDAYEQYARRVRRWL